MRFADGLDAAVAGIRQAPTYNVFVVAVDGHSAAGKSTFASRLAQRVDASIVHGDDFYRPMDPHQRAQLTAEEGVGLYYDWQRMRVEAVAVLRAGRSAAFRPYDWSRNVLHERTVTVAAAPVVIVEGLFVSRPELGDLVDMSVVVTAVDDVRRRRQLERADAPQAWLDRWEAAEQLFFEHSRPTGAFDIVVNSDL